MPTQEDIEREVQRPFDVWLGDTGDRFARPAPRMFSDEHRQREPVLAAEDTNPFFQAFARRRLHCPPWWIHDFTFTMHSPLSASLHLPMFSAFYIINQNWLHLNSSTIFIILFFVIADKPMMAYARSATKNNIPHSPHALFTLNGPSSSLLADLWLCGVTGRDIAESVYLDIRRQSLAFEKMSLVSLMVSALLSAALLAGQELATPTGLLLASGLISSTALYWFTSVWYSRPTGQVATLIEQWEPLSKKPPRERSISLESLFIWNRYLLNFDSFLVFSAIIAFFVLLKTSNVFQQLFGGSLSLFSACAMAAALAYHARSRLRYKINERNLHKILEGASPNFDQFMRVVVFDDRDAR